jgi:hypothetical protein
LTSGDQSLLEQRNEVHKQIRDLLETASIKLSLVASNPMGVSGRRKHYQFLTAQIEMFEARIAERMQNHHERIELLTTIPGVDRIVAWHLIAELGIDMSVLPDADHCANWAFSAEPVSLSKIPVRTLAASHIRLACSSVTSINGRRLSVTSSTEVRLPRKCRRFIIYESKQVLMRPAETPAEWQG